MYREFLDDDAEKHRLNLLEKLKAWQEQPSKSRFDELQAADRTVSQWIEHARITPACKEQLTKTLREVEAVALPQ